MAPRSWEPVPNCRSGDLRPRGVGLDAGYRAERADSDKHDRSDVGGNRAFVEMRPAAAATRQPNRGVANAGGVGPSPAGRHGACGPRAASGRPARRIVAHSTAPARRIVQPRPGGAAIPEALYCVFRMPAGRTLVAASPSDATLTPAGRSHDKRTPPGASRPDPRHCAGPPGSGRASPRAGGWGTAPGTRSIR